MCYFVLRTSTNGRIHRLLVVQVKVLLLVKLGLRGDVASSIAVSVTPHVVSPPSTSSSCIPLQLYTCMAAAVVLMGDFYPSFVDFVHLAVELTGDGGSDGGSDGECEGVRPRCVKLIFHSVPWTRMIVLLCASRQ